MDKEKSNVDEEKEETYKTNLLLQLQPSSLVDLESSIARVDTRRLRGLQDPACPLES